MSRHARALVVAILVGTGLAAVAPIASPPAHAAGVMERTDMTVTPVLSGLGDGLAVAARFAPDGRIFVAFKQGVVRMYDGPGDTDGVETLHIESDVHDYGDRGLLGLALDPDFDAGRPYLYVLYTLDLDPFDDEATMPRWGDTCPDPPGGNTDGCVVSARVDRYTIGADGIAVAGSMVRVLDGASTTGGGWCNQFPSHSIGTLAFGADKMLYVGAGDGASYTAADYGQFGGSVGSPTPKNPCDDRDDDGNGRGDELNVDSTRGGALRSQSVRSPSPDGYQSWDGAILRVDPDTGEAPADNPLYGGDPTNDRIIAYGLRNPYRFTFKPGTNELRLGDVGWNMWEEINTFTAGPGQTAVPNFGWPCYEGPGRQGNYDGLDLGLCESLYAAVDAGTTPTIDGVSSPLSTPEYAWIRYAQSSGDDTIPCGATGGGGSATGGQFAANDDWPADIRGAYVFGDYSRPCLVAMALDADGNPDPHHVVPLMKDVGVIDIQVGPDGDIYYLDYFNSTLWRLRPIAGNVPPVPSFTATPESGPLGDSGLEVAFDASATTDANEGEVLEYTWDLDGDGECDDATGVTATRTYGTAGTLTVALCVSDGIDATRTQRVIHPGLLAPVIDHISTSPNANSWKVGETITLDAVATDPDIEPPATELPASAYRWTVEIRHCPIPTDCHTHPLTASTGPSLALAGPDHEYYAFLRATLTVTDQQDIATRRTVELRPATTTVTIATQPPGLTVSTGSSSGPSPLTADFLVGGVAELAVPPSAVSGGQKLRFAGWADQPSAPRRRTITTPAAAATYTASYRPVVSVVSVTPAMAGVDDKPLPVTVVADVNDDVATAGMQVTLSAPDGTTTVSAPLALVSGSSTAGRWQGTVTLPQGWPTGATAVRVDATGAQAAGKWAIGPSVDVVAVSPPGPSGVRSIPPLRVLDTRIGIGTNPGRVEAGGERRVQITGLAGVPDGTTAVVANLTIVHTGAPGYATAHPCGHRPEVSNLNAGTDETVANLATVPLDAGGGFCLFTSVDADLIVDLAGAVVPGAPGYVELAPQRVVDTRVGIGAPVQPLAANEVLQIPLASLAPAGASAAVATLTVTEPAAAGYVTAYPCGGEAPVASILNFVAGQTIANSAVTALGGGGNLCVVASVDTNLIVDVSGWIAPGGRSPELVTPKRVLDTRAGAPIAAGETIRLGRSAGADDVAVIANVTATQAEAAGYLTVYPCADGLPATSNVNYGPGSDRPALVIAAFDGAGEVCIFTSATTHVLVDVQGWIQGG